MALRAAQAASRIQSLRPAQLAVTTRGMVTFDDKERGEERVWFNRQEREQLERLLKKVQEANGKQAPNEDAAEEEKLKAILGKDTDPAALAALKAWKKGGA